MSDVADADYRIPVTVRASWALERPPFHILPWTRRTRKFGEVGISPRRKLRAIIEVMNGSLTVPWRSDRSPGQHVRPERISMAS